MSMLIGLMATDLDSREIVFQMIREEGGDAVVKRRLIPLHGQHVIGIRIHDRTRDLGLTPHGIDRDQTS